jgi:hypothetical protein
MTAMLPFAHLRSRLRDSSWFAFGATTTALVLLASGGTAALVQFGTDEGHDPQHAHRPSPSLQVAVPVPSTVTVDRVVGTYHATVVHRATGHNVLADLLGPVADVVSPPPPPPAAVPEPPPAPVVPETPPLPFGPPPPPTPPTVHPPILPLPNPLPLPLPLPTPLPTRLPLPNIPVPLPGS